MPKGVEHKIPPLDGNNPQVVAKAEMPKGVEQISKYGAGTRYLQVAKSEMPKGVEHQLNSTYDFALGVWRSQRCRKALSTPRRPRRSSCPGLPWRSQRCRKALSTHSGIP